MKDDLRINRYANNIDDFISKQQYKRIVLQLPKELLTLSFNLTSHLRKKFPQREFYALYDSLKQPCCTDTLGAQHVNYDCLIHFGRACFSSPHQPNHYYIFDDTNPQNAAQIKNLLENKNLAEVINLNNIGYLLVDQPYYQFVKNEVDLSHLKVELLKLSYDAHQNDEYLLFGYHAHHLNKDNQNILIVCDEHEESFNQEMSFVEKIAFALKSLQTKLGQRLFRLEHENGQIKQQKSNLTKKLMQRYSMASQLDNYNVFGILVSNTAASFVNKTVIRCQQILKNHKKKHFIFMMNNLNQVKLGNFPEIEVYVIVSCHNHSLFSIKDFHRLVVTPTDLQIAFQKRNFDEYGFDLKAESLLEHSIHKQEQITEEETTTQIQKVHNQEIALQNKIQTLAYYQEREFKGLTFSDKKEIKKMSKGKIGLAQQYSKLQ